MRFLGEPVLWSFGAARRPDTGRQPAVRRGRGLRLAVASAALLALCLGTLAGAAADHRTLRVGIYQNSPKIALGPNAVPQGFYPEIVDHLASIFGFQVRYVPCAWSNCLDQLEAGTIDVMPDVAYSQERAQRFRFGHEAVLHSWSYIYSRPGKTLNALQELDGRRIAVLMNSIQHKRLLSLAEQRGWQVTLLPQDSLDGVLQAVSDGEAEFAVVNRFFGERREHSPGQRLARSQVVFRPAPLYLAYSRAVDPDLIARVDAALARLKSQSGSAYYVAFDRWLGRPPEAALPAWLIWFFAVFSLALGGSFAVSAYLRRRVTSAKVSLDVSQRRFRDFAEASTDWFWEMDETLRFSYFSHRFEEITGVPPSKLLGKTREETGIPGVDPSAWQKHLADLHAHRPFRNFVHPRVQPDGRIVHLSISGVPHFDGSGRFRGYRGTGTDITQQKNVEDALADALRESAAANKAKSEFLATMSHDLRTPLNAILGFSDLMHQEILGPLGSPRYRDYAADIHFSAEHLLNLVNDLLDLSRIESGNLALDREPLYLSTVLASVSRTIERMAQEAGVAVLIAIEGTERECHADRRAIEQIALNLLSNSIRHTPRGGSIRITIGCCEKSGARIVIADDGVGIAPDVLPQIFEPYARGSALTASPFHGHGLGLPICKRLVEAHGGRISVDSTLGVGTKITIELPVGAPKESDERDDRAAPAPIAGTARDPATPPRQARRATSA